MKVKPVYKNISPQSSMDKYKAWINIKMLNKYIPPTPPTHTYTNEN